MNTTGPALHINLAPGVFMTTLRWDVWVYWKQSFECTDQQVIQYQQSIEQEQPITGIRPVH